MPSKQPAFPDVRLHIVTGKGGTGKTTVATALALALAAGGRRVLLAEVEQRNGIERVLDIDPLGYTEAQVRHFPGGGTLWAVAIDPRAALQEYLERYYRLGLAGRIIDKAGAVDFAASIAPGLRDVLLTGKIYEAVGRMGEYGEKHYDTVVLDAPPTGRVSRFLNVNAEVSGLAKVGPVHNQAASVMQLLRSPETAVHLVSLPEEMPVAETLEALHELTTIDLMLGGIVVNQLREPVLTLADLRSVGAGRVDVAEVEASLVTAGVPDPGRVAQGLVADAAAHSERIALQRRQEATLKASGRPIFRLPYLSEGVTPASVHDLVDALRKGGFE